MTHGAKTIPWINTETQQMTIGAIDPRNRTEQRKFGFGLCAVLLALSGIRWWVSGTWPGLFLGLAALFFVVSQHLLCRVGSNYRLTLRDQEITGISFSHIHYIVFVA